MKLILCFIVELVIVTIYNIIVCMCAYKLWKQRKVSFTFFIVYEKKKLQNIIFI